MNTPDVKIDVVPQKDGSIAIVREARDADGQYRPDQQISIPKPHIQGLLDALSTARK